MKRIGLFLLVVMLLADSYAGAGSWQWNCLPEVILFHGSAPKE
jgi:hypothetical protein